MKLIYYVYADGRRNGISIAESEKEALQNAIKALSRRRADGTECGFDAVSVVLMPGQTQRPRTAPKVYDFDVRELIARVKKTSSATFKEAA